MSLDLSGYELRWPSSLFASEGESILRSGHSAWQERAKWLLTEALVGTTGVVDFEEVPTVADIDDDPWARRPGADDPWALKPRLRRPTQREWFTELVARASELPHASTPAPYWPQRRGAGSSNPEGRRRDARRDFARVVNGLADCGYLVEAFGQECVDEPGDLPDASEVIERRLFIRDLWPLQPERWDGDTFFGLVEVFHDLLSRPRARYYHNYNACGWHYSEFHNAPARMLYRSKVNQVFREAGIEYELAAEGEDLGRLVAVTDDARSELVHRALNKGAPETTIAARTRHAIALFRARETTVESKRSAIVALVGILEERRALIKEHIGRADEGALFEIANRYDLRHRRADQHGDYDVAFLDWIFWWYLATVELTNTLIASRTLE